MSEEYENELDVRRDIVTSIQQDLAALDKSYDRTHELREQIFEKVNNAITIMEISDNDPETLDAQVKLLNTATALLNDMDKQRLSRVGVKIKLKQNDNQEDHSKIITEFLSKLSSGNIPIVPPSSHPATQESMDMVEDTIEELFATSGDEILDTELREDPTDYS